MACRDEKESLSKARPPRFQKVVSTVLALILFGQVAYWLLLINDVKVVLPDLARETISAELETFGIKADFDEISIRASGRVEINNLRLAPAGHADAPISARRAVLDFLPEDIIFGNLTPRRIFIDDGSVSCPASTSPTGVITPIVTDIRAAISNEKGWVTVQTLQANLGEMPITSYGNFKLPALKNDPSDESSAGIKEDVREAWKAFAQCAPQVIRVYNELRSVGAASLQIEAKGEKSGAVSLDVLSRGEKFLLPGRIVARKAALAFTVLFDGADFKPGQDSRLTVEGAEWQDTETGLHVKTGRFRFAARFGKKWESPSEGYFSVCDIEINGERIDYARGFANWAKLPALTVGAYVVKGSDFVKINAVGDREKRSFSADFSADVVPGKYLSDEKIKKFLPEELGTLAFPSHAKIAGRADVAPGLEFSEANFSLRAGNVRFRGFDVRSVEGDFRLTPEKLEVTDADVRAADYRARGDFSTGFTADADYRFLLHGNTFPHLLNGILGPWWPEVWKDFRLNPKSLPYVDIEVCGQWEGRPDEFIFCGATGKNVDVGGQKIDLAELRIVELPDLLAFFDMRAEQNGLSAGGTLQWHYKYLPKYTRHSLRFQFDGTLPKDTAAALAGQGLPEILSPVVLEKPATVGVTGYLNFAAAEEPGRDRVSVNIHAPGNLTAWGVPFSDFNGTVAYDSDLLAVTVDNTGFAGGKIATVLDAETLAGEKNKTKKFQHRAKPSRAWIDLRPKNSVLTLDLDILNANPKAFFQALESVGLASGAKKTSTEKTGETARPAPAANKSPAPENDNPALDVQFAGTMILPEISALRGDGMIALRDPDIPQLHIFGGFSRLLDKLGVGVSSFKLDQAEGKFLVRKGKIYFPHLVISGKDSEINASGNYTISDGALEARAVFTVEIGEKIPVLGNILSGINRIPRLMPANVTGTLEHPKWTLDPTPSALLQSSFSEKLGTPPPD